MGTKTDPGKFDCFAAAKADEDMFVLLARDPTAAAVVRIWAECNRELRLQSEEKIQEALACADRMEQYAKRLGKPGVTIWASSYGLREDSKTTQGEQA